MKPVFDPRRLDVVAFAAAAVHLAGDEPLARYARLAAEAVEAPATDATVSWTADGHQRATPGIGTAPWLHLQARTRVAQVCQRCLGPVDVPLHVDRWFRFAADEASAAAQDADAEEDVLAVSQAFDLTALLEDELLMALPLAPRHERCPAPLPQAAVDPDFDAAEKARPNPFGVLGGLRSRKGG